MTFITCLGLYEYNRLPQGWCNSPASFFADAVKLFLAFSVILMVAFAHLEGEALKPMEVSHLRSNNLKLAQKKCPFLRHSVMFLGHLVNAGAVSVDQDKVRVTSSFQNEDLMNADGCTQS